DGSGPRMHVELFVNVADMRADGFDADAQMIGDLLVKKALSEVLKHFLLAPGKLRGRGACGSFFCFGSLLKNFNDSSCNLVGHGRATGMDILNCFEKAGRWRFLDQITACSRRQRLKNA